MVRSMKDIPGTVRFGHDGLMPAAVQDHETGEVLMLVMLDPESLKMCLETGRLHYFSPRRRKVWRKGETSGHRQEIVEVRKDCDDDALLIRVKPAGGACHQGYMSCFHRVLEGGGWRTDREKAFDPGAVYPEYTYK
jgi:phosphoribosyl-AMP cyclohydrolase